MSDRIPRSTTVQVDSQKKIEMRMSLGFALVLAVLSFLDGRPILGASMVALLCFAFFYAKNLFFVGPCPNCGAAIAELAEGSPARCPGCFLYSVRRGENLEELDPEKNLKGIYLIPLPMSGALKSPPRCWKCGIETGSSRAAKGSVDFSHIVYIKSIRNYSLNIGDCGKHDDAPLFRFAALASGSWEGLKRVGAIANDAPSSAHAALEVNDYRFHAECLRLNGFLPH